MTKTAKMGWIGAGLFVTGAGLAATGAALMTPACARWTGRRAKHLASAGSERLMRGVQSASEVIGSSLGRAERSLQRSREKARTAGTHGARRFGETLADAGEALKRI